MIVVVVVYFPNCNRHTTDKYIFRGVQFVVIPSELYIAVTYDLNTINKRQVTLTMEANGYMTC